MPTQSTVTAGIVSYASSTAAETAILAALRGAKVPNRIVLVENFPGEAEWVNWVRFAESIAESANKQVESPQSEPDGRTTSRVQVALDETDILFLRARENGGYCAGNNIALRHATTEYYLALNPDCELLVRGVEVLVQTLEVDDAIAVASGKLLREHPLSTDATDMVVDAVGGRVSRWTGRSVLQHPSESATRKGRPGWLETYTGACALFRTTYLREGGGFPEQFFLYYDELYLSEQFRADGRRVSIIDFPIAVHARHSTTRSSRGDLQSPVEAYHGARSALIYARSRGSSFLLPWLFARLGKVVLDARNPAVARATLGGIRSGLLAR